MMRVLAFEVGPFAARTLALADETAGEAILVDPGFDVEVLLDAVLAQGWSVSAVVLTHAHLDHAYGVSAALERFPGAPLCLHAADVPLYENLPMQAQAFGFPPPATPAPGHLLEDGERLEAGAGTVLVRHCPGHSPGHVVLLHEDTGDRLAVVGDVLFAGSIGRTDLWGGSLETLERSIRDVLYTLPDDTRVVPGHGPETTIGTERATNPFVRGRRGPA